MLTFAHPRLLLLALVVPPLVWWWLRRTRGGLRYPVAGLIEHLPTGRSRLAHWGGVMLRALALLLLAIAAAGPRWPDLRTRLPAEGIAVEILVDVSGSMAEPDFQWDGERVSRLDAVKRAFRLFVAGGDGPNGVTLPGRPGDLIGLVTFATRPESPCPLTLSHSVLLRMLDEEEPRTIPGEMETNVSDALVLGLHRLQSAGPRRKVLVLLSDGEHNVPRPQSAWTPRQAAQIAANLGIPVYAIDAGGEGGSGNEGAVKEESAADTAARRSDGIRTLQEVARITRGRYFPAHDTQALLQVCGAIDRLEREEIQSFQYRRYHEGYPWFGLASFVLLIMVYGLEMTCWRRLP